MPLERLRALVGEVAANLADVGDVEAVELVQPVRDRLAVPAERQVLRVVRYVVVVVIVVVLAHEALVILLLVVVLALGPGLLPLDVLLGRVALLRQQLGQPAAKQKRMSEPRLNINIYFDMKLPFLVLNKTSTKILYNDSSRIYTDYTFEYDRFSVAATYVTIPTPESLSSKETGVDSGTESRRKPFGTQRVEAEGRSKNEHRH